MLLIDNIQEQENYLRRFFTDHMSYWILVWVSINIPLFIYFYDYYNLNADLISTSLLSIGLNPYSHGSWIVASLFIQPYLLLLSSFYLLTGYNILITIVITKIVSSFFTISSSILIYKLLLFKGEKQAKLASLFFLFNPFIIFVNDVWVQPEFIPIFFLLLALYFSRNPSVHGFSRAFITSTSLIIASLTYYFPIFLIPTFAIYQGKAKNALLFSLIFLMVAIPPAVLLLMFRTTSIVASSAASFVDFNTNSVYSIFSLYSFSTSEAKLLQVVVLAIIILLSVISPVILKKFKYPIYFPLTIILSFIYILYSENLLPDAYVILIPFSLILSFIAFKTTNFLKTLSLQAFLFFAFAIAMLFDGLQYATGLFYWSYPFLHKNIRIYKLFINIKLINELLLVFFVLSLIASLIIFQLSYHNRRKQERYIGNFPAFNVGAAPSDFSLSRDIKQLLFPIFAILIILFTSMLAFHSGLATSIQTENTFPEMFFYPTHGNGQFFQQPAPGIVCYNSKSNEIFFWNQPNGSAFSRNVTDQNLRLSGSISLTNASFPGTSGIKMTLLSSTNLSAGIYKVLNIPNNLSYIPYKEKVNASIITTNKSLNTVLDFHNPTNVFFLLNNSFINYSLPYKNLEGQELIFAAELTKAASSQNILWVLTIGSTSYEAFTIGSIFFAGFYENNSWHLSKVNADVQMDQWFTTGITFHNSTSIIANVNGNTITLPIFYNEPVGNVSLNVGRYSNFNSMAPFSFTGFETRIFEINPTQNHFIYFSYVKNRTNGDFSMNVLKNFTNVKFLFLINTDRHFTLTIGNSSLTSFQPPYIISFGLLSTPYSDLSIKVINFKIGSNYLGENYLMPIIEITILYPFTLVSLSLILRKK